MIWDIWRSGMIEKVMGMSLEQAVKERVLDPLGMRHATLTPAPEQAGRYAQRSMRIPSRIIYAELCMTRRHGPWVVYAVMPACLRPQAIAIRPNVAGTRGDPRNGEARDRRRRIPRLIQGGGDWLLVPIRGIFMAPTVAWGGY